MHEPTSHGTRWALPVKTPRAISENLLKTFYFQYFNSMLGQNRRLEQRHGTQNCREKNLILKSCTMGTSDKIPDLL
jgi:hypothetical protein